MIFWRDLQTQSERDAEQRSEFEISVQKIFKIHCSEFTYSKISTATKVRGMDYYVI